MLMTLKSREQFDDYLSSGQFGDSDYLTKNCLILYDNLAELLSTRFRLVVPKPSSVSNTFDRILCRRAIDFAFAQLQQEHQKTPAEHLTKLVKFIEHSSRDANSAIAVGPVSFLNVVSEECATADIRQTFAASMRDEGASIYGISPTGYHIQQAEKAVELISQIMPSTFHGTLNMAPTAVIVKGGISSAYINENPNAFFLNDTQFDDVLLLAETLLHEALHEKMASIRLTSNLLRPAYDDITSEDAGDVLVPWPHSQSPRSWSFARALAAYHVYVHTSALYLLAMHDDGTREGPNDILARLNLHFERANYLQNALTCDRCLAHADADAMDFLDWILFALGEIKRGAEEIAGASFTYRSWDPKTIRADADAGA
ncbi:MAG: hypothetical protein ACON37_03445 [Candidatus Puniceispirillaceae bacterium]